MKQITNEGMPTYKSPFDKGHLFVKFEVEFPSTIPDKFLDDLIKILPQKNKVDLDDGEIVIELEEPKYENSKRKEAYEEDEDRGSRGQGQPCRAQ